MIESSLQESKSGPNLREAVTTVVLRLQASQRILQKAREANLASTESIQELASSNRELAAALKAIAKSKGWSESEAPQSTEDSAAILVAKLQNATDETRRRFDRVIEFFNGSTERVVHNKQLQEVLGGRGWKAHQQMRALGVLETAGHGNSKLSEAAVLANNDLKQLESPA